MTGMRSASGGGEDGCGGGVSRARTVRWSHTLKRQREQSINQSIKQASSHEAIWSNLPINKSITNEERAIKSLAGSAPSPGSRWTESQESEVGVSGRSLSDL